MNCENYDEPPRIGSARFRSMSFHCLFRQFPRATNRGDYCGEGSSRSSSSRRATFRHLTRVGSGACSRGNGRGERRRNYPRPSSVTGCLFRIFSFILWGYKFELGVGSFSPGLRSFVLVSGYGSIVFWALLVWWRFFHLHAQTSFLWRALFSLFRFRRKKVFMEGGGRD